MEDKKYYPSWKRTTKTELSLARRARRRVNRLHAQAAIRKQSMAGKIVAAPAPAKRHDVLLKNA